MSFGYSSLSRRADEDQVQFDRRIARMLPFISGNMYFDARNYDAATGEFNGYIVWEKEIADVLAYALPAGGYFVKATPSQAWQLHNSRTGFPVYMKLISHQEKLYPYRTYLMLNGRPFSVEFGGGELIFRDFPIEENNKKCEDKPYVRMRFAALGSQINGAVCRIYGSERYGQLGGSQRYGLLGGSQRYAMFGSRHYGLHYGSERYGLLGGSQRYAVFGSQRYGLRYGSERYGLLGGSQRYAIFGSQRYGLHYGSERYGLLGGNQRYAMFGSQRYGLRYGSERYGLLGGSQRYAMFGSQRYGLRYGSERYGLLGGSQKVRVSRGSQTAVRYAVVKANYDGGQVHHDGDTYDIWGFPQEWQLINRHRRPQSHIGGNARFGYGLDLIQAGEEDA